MVSHRGQENLVHLISKVGDRLRLGYSRNLFDERLAVELLLFGAVRQERVWLEIVDGPVNFIDRRDVKDASVSILFVIHVSVSQFLLALLKTARQVAAGRLRDVFLHLSEVQMLRVFVFLLLVVSFHCCRH